jgi:hypothetical protein
MRYNLSSKVNLSNVRIHQCQRANSTHSTHSQGTHISNKPLTYECNVEWGDLDAFQVFLIHFFTDCSVSHIASTSTTKCTSAGLSRHALHTCACSECRPIPRLVTVVLFWLRPRASTCNRCSFLIGMHAVIDLWNCIVKPTISFLFILLAGNFCFIFSSVFFSCVTF